MLTGYFGDIVRDEEKSIVELDDPSFGFEHIYRILQ